METLKPDILQRPFIIYMDIAFVINFEKNGIEKLMKKVLPFLQQYEVIEHLGNLEWLNCQI